MKKLLIALLIVVLTFTVAFALVGCDNGARTILVPNDGSNLTRALLLLQQEGFITLRDGAKATDALTIQDITDSKGNKISPVKAELITVQLQESPDGTLAVINGNYALQAGLSVSEDALAVESAAGDAAQQYANIIAVRKGNENTDKTKALLNALFSKEVYDYINDHYNGSVLPVFTSENFATEIAAPSGDDKTITVGASQVPHAEILNIIKAKLATAGWTLTIRTFDDYVTPNTALDEGSLDANYFQHEPYLITFNTDYKTNLVSVGKIHYEPFGLYGQNVSKQDYKDGKVSKTVE